MHRALGAGDPAAKGLANGLMAEADAENGNLARQHAHDIERHPGLMRRAGAGRDHDALHILVDRIGGNRVIAPDLGRGTELAQIARHIVDEGVVVIDDEDHDGLAKLWAMRFTLARVSSYSSAGRDFAVMPPPPWNEARPSWKRTVRMAILRSI